jgi:hypothetical protein
MREALPQTQNFMKKHTAHSRFGPNNDVDPAVEEAPDLEAEGLDKEKIAPNPDPFDPESLRASLDETLDEMDLEELDRKVLRGRPSKQNFFRIRPEQEYQMPVWILKDELTDSREIYLVKPEIAKRKLAEHTRKAICYAGVTKLGVPFIWPVPVLDDRKNSWHLSADKAVKRAQEKWVQLIPDKLIGAYRVNAPKEGTEWEEPKWPEMSFIDMLKAAFGDYYISTADHTLVKQIRGED